MSDETPDTPRLSGTALRDLQVDELREKARDAGVKGTSSMRKEDFVRAPSERFGSGDQAGGAGGGAAGQPATPVRTTEPRTHERTLRVRPSAFPHGAQ